jgi:hypothetical protein
MSAVEERSAAATPTVGLAFYPWLLIGLLWTAAFLNSAGRQILITVLPQGDATHRSRLIVALAAGAVLFASGAGKGLFDGCIYAAMHEVVPPTARATAVGLMTLVGFCGAGLAPIGVAQASEWIGMAPAMTSLAALYLAATVLLIATRGSTRRTILETRLIEDGGR